MAATRLISIEGKKNAGKTTLVVALVAELVRRKFRVMTLKHGTHAANLDHEGKDTWRHFHEGKAERVLLEAPGERVVFERTRAETPSRWRAATWTAPTSWCARDSAPRLFPRSRSSVSPAVMRPSGRALRTIPATGWRW